MNVGTATIQQDPSPGGCHVTSMLVLGDKLSADVYEELVNRGWRRCGTYYYKPNLDKSCCKCYTIRMDVAQFKIKKQQRKTVKNILELLKPKKPKAAKGKKDSKTVEAPPNKQK
jgi:arginyl-tRNA--protein-N-Asp/Glu arginylyltransferase